MGQAAYTSAVLADTPFCFYKFDEASGNPQDSSGNARHITSTDGSPTYQQAGPMTGGSFSIRSVNSHQFNRSPSSTSATNNMTVEFWVKADVFLANDQRIWNVGNASTGFSVFVDTDLTFQVKLSAGSGTAMSNSTGALSAAAFRHIVITRDAGTWKYYIDGSLDTANAGTAAPANPTAQPMQWNQDFGANQGQYISNGAYYTTALSAARVLAHYNAAIGVASGYAAAGIVGTGTSTSETVETGNGVTGLFASGVKEFTGASGYAKTNYGTVGGFAAGSSVHVPFGGAFTKAGRGVVGLTAASRSASFPQPQGVSIGFAQSLLTAYPDWTRIDG